jgi:glyoxylase-like metal-dependent hydrolase (beta-lactamase superfamily II)
MSSWRLADMLRAHLLRAITLVALAWLVAQALPARAQQPVPLRAVAVSPGIWALVGPIGGPSRDNHALNATYGVVATPEGTILIDSGASAQGARLLAEMAQQLTGQPVRWVVNTGSQHHRWFGNDPLRRAGAQLLAHARTVQTQRTLAGDQTAELQALLGERFDGTAAAHADRMVDGARTELSLGGVRLELLDLGDAHFPGDVVVWLPATKIAFAGDLVYAERLLSLGPSSNGPSWLRAFDRLAALAPTQIVPGHGAPVSLDVAQAQTGAYLRFVTAGVVRHAREMAGVEAALAELGHAPAFAALANYDQLHRVNVNRAYLRAEAAN